MKSAFVYIILFTITGRIMAQNESIPSEIHLQGKYFGDRVVLRWAPDHPDLWKLANKSGYRLERLELDSQNNQFLPVTEAIFPWSLEQFAVKADTSDRFQMVAAQLLHGEKVVPEVNDPLQAVKVLSDEQNTRFSYALLAADLSADAATGLGLRYEDTAVEADKNYIYRIFLNDATGHELNPDTVYLQVSTDRIPEVPKVNNIFATPGDSMVTVLWGKENNEVFTAFWLERSSDGGNNYLRLHQLPYITSEDASSFYSFIDRLDQNYKPYHYRIRGINLYAEVSPPSDPVVVMGRDQKPPSPPVNVKAEAQSPAEIMVNWEADDKAEDHAGFLVQRSSSLQGPFNWITPEPLPVGTRSYTDTEPYQHTGNYYMVYAFDTAGNVSPSNISFEQIQDSIPPDPPKQLRGSIDTTGALTLSWTWGPEPDIIGYRVYASHQDQIEFQQVTRDFLKDTVFTDTLPLNTLSENIYYKIVAVDLNYNHSGFSEVLILKKPDLIPPNPVVFKNSIINPEAVLLEWMQSPSPDVAEQILYRRENEKDWEMLARIDYTFNSLMDSSVQSGNIYQYAIEVMDDDSLFSGKSQPLTARLRMEKLKPGVEDVVADLDQKTGQLSLSWKFTAAQDQQFKFQIYRSYQDLGLMSHQSVPAGSNLFIETIPQERRFEYAVKVIYADGQESGLSEIVSVQY